MGWIPSEVTTGSNIGVKISIAGVISMNVPTTNRMILIIKQITILLSDTARSAALIVWGIFSYAKIHDIAVDVAIRSITTAVVIPVSSRSLGRSLGLPHGKRQPIK